MTDSLLLDPEIEDQEEDLGNLLLEVLPGDGSTIGKPCRITMDTQSHGMRSIEAARGFNAQGT